MIDKCPLCGARLVGQCKIIVLFDIYNNHGKDQEWAESGDGDAILESTRENPEVIQCPECDSEWDNFELDDNGNLISLGDIALTGFTGA